MGPAPSSGHLLVQGLAAQVQHPCYGDTMLAIQNGLSSLPVPPCTRINTERRRRHSDRPSLFSAFGFQAFRYCIWRRKRIVA